jgi:hypothetical protein
MFSYADEICQEPLSIIVDLSADIYNMYSITIAIRQKLGWTRKQLANAYECMQIIPPKGLHLYRYP